MLKKIAIGFGVVIAIVLVLAATKPDTFRVQRTLAIKAPPAKLVPLIEDFSQWKLWSPYEKLDPALKRTYSTPPGGKGAVYTWAGNDKAGEGRMEILESTPSKVTIKLDFFKPFEGHNTADFTLVPKGDSTEVTWGMTGPSPFPSKIMQVFMNMDSLIGDDFALGLENMKRVAEK